MIKWLLAIVLLLSTVVVADNQVGMLGNENEIGGWFGREVTTHNIVGIDTRWLDETDEVDDGYSLSVFVMWEAVPRIGIPIDGWLPQFDSTAVPTSLDAAVDLGGRVGVKKRDETDPEIVVFAQLRFNPDGNANVGIRYEYKFDADLWSDIGNIENQHQAFLILVWRF